MQSKIKVCSVCSVCSFPLKNPRRVAFKSSGTDRVYIAKPDGKQRSLGIPTPKDKVIQQAIRMLFESVYEPLFINTYHGFRPGRSIKTAVFEVRKWNGITWMIEGFAEKVLPLHCPQRFCLEVSMHCLRLYNRTNSFLCFFM